MTVLIEGTPLRRSPFMDAHAASTFFGALSVWMAVAATASVALRLAGLRRNFVDVQSRVVSTIHAVVAVAGALHALYFDSDSPGLALFFEHDAMEQAAFGRSAVREFHLLVSAAYLAYDIVLCAAFYRQLGDWCTFLHHAVVISAFASGCHYGIGTLHMAVLLLNELSTPFLNARYFMLCSDRTPASWYLANGLALVVTFFLCRIVVMVLLIGHILWSWAVLYELWPVAPVGPRALVLALHAALLVHLCLNAVWFSFILAHVRRALARLGPAPPPAAGPPHTPFPDLASVPAPLQASGESKKAR